jgi:excisionase family DNA binding protein
MSTPEMSNNNAAVVDADLVLAVEDVAALLRVGRNTVYALVAKNQIPHRRLGKQIRFSRAALMQWLSWSWQVAKEGK